MNSFSTEDHLKVSFSLNKLLSNQTQIKEKQISSKVNQYSNHSLVCQSQNKAMQICITNNCQQSNAFICSDDDCPCQDTHLQDCQFVRLRIIFKKLRENDGEVSKAKQQKQTIIKNLIDFLINQFSEDNSLLEKKLIRENVSEEYQQFKHLLKKQGSIENFSPTKALKLYTALMDKTNKPIESGKHIERIQKFAQNVQKLVQNHFESTQMISVKNSSDQKQLDSPLVIKKLKQEISTESSPNREEEQQESDFKIEQQSSDDLLNLPEVVQRLDFAVQTEKNDIFGCFGDFQKPTQTINPQGQNQPKFQMLNGNTIGEQVPMATVTPGDFEALKNRYNKLVNEVREIKKKQTCSNEQIQGYNCSNYFHVGPRCVCISVYSAFFKLKLEDYE